jgi:hypothetical protein
MRRLYRLPLAVSLFLVMISGGTLRAQETLPVLDEFSSGMHYLLAFPDTSMNAQLPLYADNRFGDRFLIQIYSSVANAVTLKSGNGKISRRITMAANSFTTVDVGDFSYTEFAPPVVTAIGSASTSTYRLDADAPVLVTCYIQTRSGAEAWTPLPIEAWGQNYFAAMVPGDIIYDLSLSNNKLIKKPRPAESKVLVVAAYDSTMVSIAPSGRMNPSFPYTIRLDAGQAYQFQSFVDTAITSPAQQADLGGSRITSTRPVGVITGNSRGPVADDLAGQLRNSYKNPFIEALAPAEQHGKEFVYMPTSDVRRTTTKRAAEFARIYGTSPGTTTGYRRLTNGLIDSFTVTEGAFKQLEFDRTSPAVRITTTRPAQAMMHSSAVVVSTGTSFDVWSGGMTELVPREQWTSFAPISIPVDISGMEHFVNVVTDAASAGDIYRQDGSLFPFNQGTIPGTNLVWGTVQISASMPFWIEGRDGALFSAVSYGLSKGNESSGTTRTVPWYKETIALAYNHAIAPHRRVLSAGDSLHIDSVRDCSGTRFTLRSLSSSPAGLRSVTLESPLNARIVSFAPNVYVNAPVVTISVAPVDPLRDAHGRVRIEDRTGKIWLVEFDYHAEKLLLAPGSRLDLGEMMTGESARGDVMITNPTGVAERIRSIRLIAGDRDLSIVSTLPTFPAVIGANGSLPITIEAAPRTSPARFTDTLRVELECTTWSIPVTMESVEPCIDIADLSFDTIPVRESRQLPLKICNSGRGRLTFHPVREDSIIVWSDRRFSVSTAYQNLLRTASLGPGECITIQVLFNSSQAGTFHAVAQIGTSAPHCTDSSNWTAVAGTTVGVDEEPISMRLAIFSATAGADRDLSIRFRHDRTERVSVELFDAGGALLLARDAGEMDPGEHRLDIPATSLPAGWYLVRIGAGRESATGWCVIGR